MIPASLYDNSASSSAISYENAASPKDVQSNAKSSLRGGDDDEEEEDGVMETILEDSSMEFVWVSETTATTISEGEEEEVEEEPSNIDKTMSKAISSSLNQESSSSSTSSSIFGWGHQDSDTSLLSEVWDRTRDYCTSYYKSAFSSSSSTSTSTSSLSTSRSRQQQHKRGVLPRKSRIHESYDWVSNVQIEGGQLILPGQLIVLDDGNYGNTSSSSTTASATTQNCYNIDEDGGSLGNSNGLSSTATKSTIMVSAHDLLATTTKKSQGDDDEYDVTTNNNTTSSSTSRFSKAIWKFAKRKTKKAVRYVQRPVLSTSTYLSTRLRRIEERYHLLGSTMGWVSGTILGDCDDVDEDDDVDDGNNGDDDATTKGSSTINIELTSIAQSTSPRPTDFNTLN